MTVTHGMNVDEVKALGQLLTRHGQELDQLARRLDREVGTSRWGGPDADQFKRSSWPTHRAALLRASQELTAFGKTAQVQADEQLLASGDQIGALLGPLGIGSGGSGGSGGPIDHAWNAVSNGFGTIGGIAGLTRVYASLGSTGTKEAAALLHILDSPFVRSLSNMGDITTAINSAPKLWHTAFDASLSPAERLGNVVSVGASALKSQPNPAMYLTGVALESGVMIAEQAAKADLSAGAISNTWNYGWQHTDVVAQEVGKAVKTVLWDNFPRLFG